MLQYNPQEHPNSSLECQVLSIILNKEVMSYMLEVCFLFSFLFFGGEGEVTDSYFNIYCKRTWICPIAFKVKIVIPPITPHACKCLQRFYPKVPKVEKRLTWIIETQQLNSIDLMQIFVALRIKT